MAANPQMVIKNIPAGTFTYDGVPNSPILRGQVIDVPNGSALATALSGFIASMTAQQCTPGTSDSISPLGTLSSQAAGGGTDPYNAHQAG